MRRASEIAKDSEQITTVKDLTDVFESLASSQVAKIKNKVALSTTFFNLLWTKYTAIRIDEHTRITHRDLGSNGRNVFVIITAEAGLSGDLDQRLLEAVLQDYDKSTTDLIVLGAHGAMQLSQRGINYSRYFRVPESDSYIDVTPVIEAITPYKQVTIYYEEYETLGTQNIKKMDLVQTIKTLSEDVDTSDNIITERDTIFEPSLEKIADTMETAMMSLAFSQAILESQLAQDASRFNAMAVAKKRATELVGLYSLEFHRAKRADSDRRMREVITSIKRKKRLSKHV